MSGCNMAFPKSHWKLISLLLYSRLLQTWCWYTRRKFATLLENLIDSWQTELGAVDHLDGTICLCTEHTRRSTSLPIWGFCHGQLHRDLLSGCKALALQGLHLLLQLKHFQGQLMLQEDLGSILPCPHQAFCSMNRVVPLYGGQKEDKYSEEMQRSYKY